MSKWKRSSLLVILAVAALVAVQVGNLEASGRDNALCRQACNDTRDACNAQCVIDCAGDSVCEDACQDGCIDDSQECKKLCSPKTPPTIIDP